MSPLEDVSLPSRGEFKSPLAKGIYEDWYSRSTFGQTVKPNPEPGSIIT